MTTCTCITLSDGSGVIRDPWCLYYNHGDPAFVNAEPEHRAWPGTDIADNPAVNALKAVNNSIGSFCGPPAEVRCECAQYWIAGVHAETCPRFVKR